MTIKVSIGWTHVVKYSWMAGISDKSQFSLPQPVLFILIRRGKHLSSAPSTLVAKRRDNARASFDAGLRSASQALPEKGRNFPGVDSLPRQFGRSVMSAAEPD